MSACDSGEVFLSDVAQATALYFSPFDAPIDNM